MERIVGKKWVVLSVLLLSLCGLVSGCRNTPQMPPENTNSKEDIQITMEEGNDVTFTQLALGQVQAGGWLLDYLRLQAENITGQFERLSPDVKPDGPDRSGWLGGTGESWERGPYYVKGLVALAYTLQNRDLIDQAQKWIDWTLESQVESGLFGPYASDRNQFDWWAVMPMLFALENYYDATLAVGQEDVRVIPFLTKYFEAQQTLVRKKPFEGWSAARACDNILAVFWLYEKTNEESLLELCHLLYQQTNWEAAYTTDAWRNVYHIVNVHQSFKLFPLMYAVTGDNRYLDVYYEGMENLYAVSGRVDGMSNGDEATQGIGAVHGTETCAVAEQMLSDEIALMITRDAGIADHLEWVAYNAWPAQLTPEMTGQVYFNMQNQVMATLGSHGFSTDGGDRSVYGTPGGYPCCIHNFQMGWPLFVNSMWMASSDGGFAAGAYGPCVVKQTVGTGEQAAQVTVTESTEYPFEETVTLRLSMDRDTAFPLYLRIPEWCSAPQLFVNGHLQDQELPAGRYVRLQAVWQNGDTVRLVFPAAFSYTYTENNSISIRRGPLVYAMAIEEDWNIIDYNPNQWNLTKQFPSYSITPSGDWNYALYQFDFEDIASNFTVEKVGVGKSFRFTQDQAPIRLTCQAVKVPSWTVNDAIQAADTVPVSPVKDYDGQVLTVTLLPFGFTKLRIALIPWTGDHRPVYEMVPRAGSADGVLLSNIICPIPQNADALGQPVRTYSLTFQLEASASGTMELYLNTKYYGTVAVQEGSHSYTVPNITDLSYKSYNKAELRAVKGSSLHFVRTARITEVIVAEDDSILRFEAERGVVSGSAYATGKHVAGIDDTGSGVAFRPVPIAADGTYRIRIYYASPTGGATHSLLLDGQNMATVQYGRTVSWGTFDEETYIEVDIPLTAGNHTIQLVKTAADRGFAELDAFTLEKIA